MINTRYSVDRNGRNPTVSLHAEESQRSIPERHTIYRTTTRNISGRFLQGGKDACPCPGLVDSQEDPRSSEFDESSVGTASSVDEWTSGESMDGWPAKSRPLFKSRFCSPPQNWWFFSTANRPCNPPAQQPMNILFKGPYFLQRRKNWGRAHYHTGARARRYNIAAFWAILYCLAPGPRVSPHQLFYAEQERAIHTHITHTLILTLCFSFDLFIFCPPSFLFYPSVSGFFCF